MQSHFGTVQTEGLTLVPGGEYGHNTQMRSFRWDLGPAAGWSAEWQIEDRYGLLPKGRQVRVRYTDLTDSVDVGLAEGWVVAGSFNGVNETWIPRLLVRRRKGDAGEAQPFRSTFVAIIDPYAEQPTVRAARRLPIKPAAGKGLAATHVALSITLADGTRDVVIFQDPDASLNPRMKVMDIISEPLTTRGELNRREKLERIKELMNIVALREEIREARRKTKGILGVNIMTALTDFSDMVKASVEEGIDIIFSGAGLPLNLPTFLNGSKKTKLVPIVSSGRAARLISKRWIEKYNYAMKLALFHTIFNVIGVLAVAPFTSKLVILLESLFIDKRIDISRAKYLDSTVIEVPEIAIV